MLPKGAFLKPHPKFVSKIHPSSYYTVACYLMLIWVRSIANIVHLLLTRAKGQCSRSKTSMPFKHDLALQSIPLSKQPFKTQPQIAKQRRHLKSLDRICMPQEPAQGIVTIRSGVRWFILDSSHCTGDMYHILHARV